MYNPLFKQEDRMATQINPNTIAKNAKDAGQATAKSANKIASKAQDTVESSASDLSSVASSATSAASAAAQTVGDVASTVSKRVGQWAKDMNVEDWPEAGRDLATRVDKHARSNPWLHIGLVGVGALALGYLFGRSASPSTSTTQVKGFSTEMGRGYGDFEEGIDE
jgi:ElaB/YqjD/DUF883 family membrane-anchored ribosome-binding protein